ncbi:MAG: hypothetical protein HUU35_16130, partial [Armatimonadetes bacterium]|nr:hypothetical protein [Armatimonadota bacterium]
MNRLLLPLALAAALLEAAPAAYDLALVPNGSFELDANRDGSPDGWTGSAFNSPGSVAWDRAVARSGAASVRAADSKGDPADTSWPGHSCRWVLNRTFACRPGEVFTLRGWVKAELTEGTASLVVAWFAGSKWLAEKGPQAVTGRTDWRELTARLETPAGADTARVYLMLGRAVGQAWFDDVEVYRGER